MDIFMLLVTIFGGIICLVVDIYYLILYIHRDEQLCYPTSIFSIIIIIISLLQVQLQPLFLLFDVISSRHQSTDFTSLWTVIYFSILVNIAFLKPLASSLYESDEEDSCLKRICWTFVEVIITVAGFGLFLGIGWLFWGKIYLPVQQIVAYEQFTNGAIAEDKIQSFIEVQINIQCFLIGILCLLGYPVLACCGACGLTALPFSMFVEFKNRPKWRRTNQARAIAEQLKKQTIGLIKEADSVKRSLNRMDFIDGWFSKRKKNNQLEIKVTELENKLSKHLDFYQLFRLQLDMKNANPWIFFIKLVGGILCIILTPLWLIQILLTQLVLKQSVFLDKFLVLLENQSASFLAVAFILILTFYMVSATLKGIFFVSQYLPFFKIHPMEESKTWLNSFMFQAVIALLSSTSITHLLLNSFPQYLRGGDIALMMGIIIERMLFIGVFIYHKVFVYIFLIMTVLGSIFSAYLLFCTKFKSQSQQRIEQIRKKLFGKNNKEKQLQFEMTEMNLKGKQHKSEKKKKDKLKKKQVQTKAGKISSQKKKKKNKVKLVLE